MSPKKRTGAKELIMEVFQENGGKMCTAEILKEKSLLSGYSLATIKTALSRLKKEKKLIISFRTRGSHGYYKKVDGKRKGYGGFFKGKCYYKLRDWRWEEK